MGEAKRKRMVKEAEAAGVVVVLPDPPPKKIRRTWDFDFSQAAYADFRKVFDYLLERMGEDGPQDERVLAERMLAIGLKFFLAEIAKEQKAQTRVQEFTPADMAEASRRLQELKNQQGRMI